ncbi:MAG: CopD family protein [Terriglobia bacterium]
MTPWLPSWTTPWLLVVHVLGIILWMGALLMVTQILATHAGATEVAVRQALTRLEMKLFRGLAHPGAALVVVTGITLIYVNPHYYLPAGWLHTKLLLVILLVGLDFWVYRKARAFHAGRSTLQARWCKAVHGVMNILLIAILLLVFLKPFEP